MSQLDLIPPPGGKDNPDDRFRHGQLLRRFVAFHEAHHWVWEEFDKIALAQCKAGAPYLSADVIVQQIRRDKRETRGEVKINNDFRAFYARKFDADHKEFEGRFRNRKQKSKERPAYGQDMAVVPPEDPGDEEWLKEFLRNLK